MKSQPLDQQGSPKALVFALVQMTWIARALHFLPHKVQALALSGIGCAALDMLPLPPPPAPDPPLQLRELYLGAGEITSELNVGLGELSDRDLRLGEAALRLLWGPKWHSCQQIPELWAQASALPALPSSAPASLTAPNSPQAGPLYLEEILGLATTAEVMQN